MPAMKSKATDPWAAMDALMRTKPEPVGAEWFTAEQFGDRYGYSAAVAHNKLLAMFKSGKLDKWKGLSGTCRRITTKFRVK